MAFAAAAAAVPAVHATSAAAEEAAAAVGALRDAGTRRQESAGGTRVPRVRRVARVDPVRVQAEERTRPSPTRPRRRRLRPRSDGATTDRAGTPSSPPPR